eukprot:TRINITY_DN10328_c0_g1_i9.p1 TRINITY_DN10328_c0_g1~~TRINITY_DN10328_c0_g1_i9.p1  ORF type:complete len:259 (+),score=62.63 TRINITY_DN10328_c0_g1_i9:25-777(+)
MLRSLVGSEMCIRDRYQRRVRDTSAIVHGESMVLTRAVWGSTAVCLIGLSWPLLLNPFLIAAAVLVGLFRWWLGAASPKPLESRCPPGIMEADGADGADGEAVAMLLANARRELSSDNPADAVKALENVVQAMRVVNGGDEQAVLQAILRAKQEHERVVISQEQPGPGWERFVSEDLHEGESTLAETGRDGIIEAAARDGSSLVCPVCNGLIKRTRWAAHKSTWCPGLETDPSPNPNPNPGQETHPDTEH